MDIPKGTLKPKVALIKDGKVPTKLGRGRMSAEQKNRVMELVELGWKIEGFSINTAPTTKTDSPKVVRVNKVDSDAVIEIRPYRYDIDQFKAVTLDGKKTFGMKEACNNCGYSLCGHLCDKPSVHGYPVMIVGK